jgi:hypothetical protein
MAGKVRCEFMDVEELLARESIRDTLASYNFSGDRGRVDLLAEAFTDDGVLEFEGGAHHGREAIVAALSPSADDRRSGHESGQPFFLRHNLTSNRIEFTGADTARSWTYFQVMTPIGIDHCGVYVDELRKTGERWLISSRRVKLDWRSPDSLM